jgi:hypothetical protein
MSDARIVWLVVSIALVSAVGISSTIIHQKIWWLVNLKEPGRFDSMVWYASKTSSLYASYRVHYPGGRLIIFNYLLGGIGLVSVLCCVGHGILFQHPLV